jgi:peptidoglycan/xylan/chitin deacetylase (PgdA/CDA1 family)
VGFSRQRLRQCKNVLGYLLKNGTGGSCVKNSVVNVTRGNTPAMSPRKHQGIFAAWLALEALYGFKSTFFFLPERVSLFHPFDGPLYRYLDRVEFEGHRLTVAELMREIESRGWEVGLHGSFLSYDDAEELKRQKEQVEQALKKEIVSIRQHYLHFDRLKTPKAQSQAGFSYDSTFGSNRIIGFRNGLALPFYFYDFAAEAPLNLLEIPLHIQDGALFRDDNLSLPPPLALRRVRELIDKVEAVNGVITLLWHPNVAEQHFYPGWFWVYEELLKYLSVKDVWVTSVREIGQWWDLRRQKAESLTHLKVF